ncbi:hypothetical protein M422DRAFT_265209 [Sphaerobolus stellatus SS14]|uniref:Uncharacterized protein n=1 Tax=Sphaerobolus stellatus (strain SS14) TaxID=990650 RepID=A0A0C9V677_SPHS4|nr:hypothetical protein M422DRAFT_265209 [Sphaerobolus stellatus SS14]
MASQPLYHPDNAIPGAYIPPANGGHIAQGIHPPIISNDSNNHMQASQEPIRINTTAYGYPNYMVPIQHPQSSYEHNVREPRHEEVGGTFDASVGGLQQVPPIFQPPTNSNCSYQGGGIVAINHNNHSHPISSSGSVSRTNSSNSPDQSGKPGITEGDNNIYAAFLQFRNCLQKYVHDHVDSPVSLAVFWRSIHNIVEVSIMNLLKNSYSWLIKTSMFDYYVVYSCIIADPPEVSHCAFITLILNPTPFVFALGINYRMSLAFEFAALEGQGDYSFIINQTGVKNDMSPSTSTAYSSDSSEAPLQTTYDTRLVDPHRFEGFCLATSFSHIQLDHGLETAPNLEVIQPTFTTFPNSVTSIASDIGAGEVMGNEECQQTQNEEDGHDGFLQPAVLTYSRSLDTYLQLVSSQQRRPTIAVAEMMRVYMTNIIQFLYPDVPSSVGK